MGLHLKPFILGVIAGTVIHHHLVKSAGLHNGFDNALDKGEAKLKETVEKVRSSDDPAADAAQTVKDGADKVADKISDAADKAAAKVSDTAAKAATRTRRTATKAADKTKENVDKVADAATS